MPCRPKQGAPLRSPPLPPAPPTGERLEDKLDAILELFQRQLVTPPPPPPPVLLRRNGAGELPTSFTDVGVEVAGVRLSWQDAHAFCAVEQFAAVAKTLCGFPSFFAAPLLRRIRHQYGAEKVAVGYGVDSVASSPEWRTLTPAEEAAQVAALTGGGSAARGPSAGEESKHSGSDFVVRRSIVLNLGPERPSAPEDLADRDVSTHVSLPAFLTYWRAEMEPYDACDRFLRLVSKRSGASARGVGRVMESADFMPFMEELLVWAGVGEGEGRRCHWPCLYCRSPSRQAFHPGLAFLESTPEFQEKYARTVIARIFYVLDPTARRCIDARQLRRSNLLDAFHTVDIEEDINMVNDYFSYEHFYVLYCKFWELDTDHDFLLSRPDLNKLMDLTHVVLDRVFSQAGRPFTSGKPGATAAAAAAGTCGGGAAAAGPSNICFSSSCCCRLCRQDGIRGLHCLLHVRGGQVHRVRAALLVHRVRPGRRRRPDNGGPAAILPVRGSVRGLVRRARLQPCPPFCPPSAASRSSACATSAWR